MKTSLKQTATGEWFVAVEQDQETRCYFKYSSQTCCVALQNLNRDIARHGQEVINFDELPVVTSRIAKSGRKVYELAA